MKNMRKILMIILSVALVALPTMAQSFSRQDQPQTQFQSTSTLQGSGSSYSANPSLNADGTAFNPSESTASAKPGSPRKSPELIITPQQLQEGSTPLGDAVWPLMLMALAYLGVRFFRARKRALNG